MEMNQSGRISHVVGCIISTVLFVGLVLLIIPCFITGPCNPQDTRMYEVKANIHMIQITLERYAVDNGGRYPLFLYGGDSTDTFVDPRAGINPDTGRSWYLPPGDPHYSPYPGDFDALIVYGYMVHYPENPFMRDYNIKKHGCLTTCPVENGFGPLELHTETDGRSRVSAFAYPEDRALQYVERKVGGVNGQLMWDVSEGQRHPPWPIIITDPESHSTGYLNPRIRDGLELDNEIEGDHLFLMLPGNFYYYATFEEPGGYSSFYLDADGNPDASRPILPDVVGYHLCGYGNPVVTGEDVYNLWGDFEENSILSVQEGEIYYGYANYLDGRHDGVIIVTDDMEPPPHEQFSVVGDDI